MVSAEGFADMNAEALEAWVRRVYAEWQLLPEALAVLAEREGLSYGELGRRLGMHKSTVQRRARRARARR